jgi:hypothetical protein
MPHLRSAGIEGPCAASDNWDGSDRAVAGDMDSALAMPVCWIPFGEALGCSVDLEVCAGSPSWIRFSAACNSSGDLERCAGLSFCGRAACNPCNRCNPPVGLDRDADSIGLDGDDVEERGVTVLPVRFKAVGDSAEDLADFLVSGDIDRNVGRAVFAVSSARVPLVHSFTPTARGSSKD